MTNRFFIILIIGFIVLTIGACSKDDGPMNNEPDVEIYKDPSYSVEERVEDLLARMTVDEKVGQMTQAGRAFLADNRHITLYKLGSLLSGGGSAPAQNDAWHWSDMYDQYQQAALNTRLGIPLIYGVDAVHGHNNVIGATIFPHNIGLGCTRNPQLVEQAMQITAKEVAATGIDWTFAPCIAVARDERWGRTYEGFGETPELQEIFARAAVNGLQGSDLSDPETIVACAKHFVGDGGTTGGQDQGNSEFDAETMMTIHMPGYIEAIEQGVGTIMVSFSSWNGLKMHANYSLLTEYLKADLGFDGFLISDWAAHTQLEGDLPTQVETTINAGLDMIMVPDDYPQFIGTMLTLIDQNRISMERIDDAVRRILRIKFRLGLFEQPFADHTITNDVGLPAHREVARECVRQSLVLLKNNDNVLPLSKDLARVHVAGKNADDIGHQCGGWTISWQGSSGETTPGTTILEAIENTVSTSTLVTFSVDGSGAAGADVGIVVVGETPYAEGSGDRQNLNLDAADVTAITNLHNSGIPVVVILIAGRPMIIEPILDMADAFVAAWLPGTEGQGVADVIFGDYHPTGRLSHTWPRTMDQIPINRGDAVYDPLFPYDYGLSY